MNTLKEEKKKKHWTYYNDIFRKDGFKPAYKDRANKMFKEFGLLYGKWGICSSNNLYGILDDNKKWSFLNTLNTHPRCFQYICELYEEKTENNLNFNNKSDWIIEIDKLWTFLGENYQLFFTKKKKLKIDELNEKNKYQFKVRIIF